MISLRDAVAREPSTVATAVDTVNWVTHVVLPALRATGGDWRAMQRRLVDQMVKAARGDADAPTRQQLIELAEATLAAARGATHGR